MATKYGTGKNETILGTDQTDYIFGLGGHDYLSGGQGADYLDGGEGNDTLEGGAGDDVLYGYTGIDSLVGGTGNDSYYVDNRADIVYDGWQQGNDTVFSSASSWQLGYFSEIEFVILTESAVSVVGNNFNNNLIGNSTANYLDGGQGGDTLLGYGGNDVMLGGYGSDVLDGGTEADYLDGGYDNDTLKGGSGTDSLIGGQGNDFLDGGLGVDSMAGGIGDDAYIVDNSGDVVFERPGEGIDTVFASVAWVLNNNIENLWLSGSATRGIGASNNNLIVGTQLTISYLIDGLSGSDTIISYGKDDTLYGGDGADYLDGGYGNDILIGDNLNSTNSSGRDTLYGGLGNDTIYAFEDVVFGGAGDDVLNGLRQEIMYGGLGNDTYIGSLSSDVVEYANEGIDWFIFRERSVYQSDTYYLFSPGVSGAAPYNLQDNIENLILENHYYLGQFNGNAQNNLMIAQAGIYFNGQGGDDTLIGSIEKDYLSGGAGNDLMKGGGGNDELNGGGGIVDSYIGGRGDDTLKLANGTKDIVSFAETFIAGRIEGKDIVQNFNWNEDKIDLSALFNDLGVSSQRRVYGTDFFVLDRAGDVDELLFHIPNQGFQVIATITVANVLGGWDSSDFIV